MSGGTAAGGARAAAGAGGASSGAGSPAAGAGVAPQMAGGSGSAGASAGGGAAGTPGSAGASVGGGAAGTPSSAGAAGAAGTSSISFMTNFDLTESPISEHGAWHHLGLDWTTVDTEGGNAIGTQALGVARSGPTQYNDSYAYLSGFPANQSASAVVHIGTIDASCTHEVEIILRWSDSAHLARGYECNVAFDGSYAQIVRWNGAVGDYTYLEEHGSVPGGVHDGDVISASAIGNQIALSVNGIVRAMAQDATLPTGNPGVAFWRGSTGCGTRGDYGFSSFSASASAP